MPVMGCPQMPAMVRRGGCGGRAPGRVRRAGGGGLDRGCGRGRGRGRLHRQRRDQDGARRFGLPDRGRKAAGRGQAPGEHHGGPGHQGQAKGDGEARSAAGDRRVVRPVGGRRRDPRGIPHPTGRRRVAMPGVVGVEVESDAGCVPLLRPLRALCGHVLPPCLLQPPNDQIAEPVDLLRERDAAGLSRQGFSPLVSERRIAASGLRTPPIQVVDRPRVNLGEVRCGGVTPPGGGVTDRVVGGGLERLRRRRAKMSCDVGGPGRRRGLDRGRGRGGLQLRRGRRLCRELRGRRRGPALGRELRGRGRGPALRRLATGRRQGPGKSDSRARQQHRGQGHDQARSARGHRGGRAVRRSILRRARRVGDDPRAVVGIGIEADGCGPAGWPCCVVRGHACANLEQAPAKVVQRPGSEQS